MLRETVQKTVARFAAPTDQEAASYRTLRKGIGVLGIALPVAVLVVALFVFHQEAQPSISAYYYTGSRNLFVGILFAIGFFMLCYKGPQQMDHAISFVAGLAAIGVAFLPTAPAEHADHAQQVVAKLHYVAAGVFFALITGMALLLFTKGDTTDPAKRRRNMVFRACGWTMAACLLVLGAQALLFPGSKQAWNAHGITFLLETVMIEAFGIAWLVKGAGGDTNPPVAGR